MDGSSSTMNMQLRFKRSPYSFPDQVRKDYPIGRLEEQSREAG
jgi:hypothetical protein